MASTSVQITLPNGSTYTQPTGLLINGQFIPSHEENTFETINPYTQQPICHVYRAKEKDIDDAVHAAKAALPGWRKVTTQKKGGLLYELARLIKRDAGIISAIESIDGGKPIKLAKTADVEAAADCLSYYGGWADKIKGQTLATDTGSLDMTLREPYGVCGLIIPWNFPLLITAWKLGPALATGNTVVLKPAELTPLSALYLGKLTIEAGFPPGVINIVPGFGHDAGAALSAHPGISKISSRNVLGDPFNGETFLGPQISAAQHSKILSMVEEAKRQGAVCMTGGKAAGSGWFIEPTIFRDVSQDMTIMREEVFGPVVAVAPFKTKEDALALANETCYGLAAGVFTADLKEAMYLANGVEAGAVWVNCYNAISHRLPFGGYKMSGDGRDLGEAAIEEFTQVKTVRLMG